MDNENIALKQLKERNYSQKYLTSTNSQFSIFNSQLYLVGIEFDKDKKNISTLEWEKIDRLRNKDIKLI